ncbi:hypothetical protein ACTMU2_37810 [Cupriavidus basilensis]
MRRTSTQLVHRPPGWCIACLQDEIRKRHEPGAQQPDPGDPITAGLRLLPAQGARPPPTPPVTSPSPMQAFHTPV